MTKVMNTSERIMTTYHPNIIDPDTASSLYNYFKDNIAWIDGVKSKNGFTRKAKSMALGENDVLDNIIMGALLRLNIHEIGIYGIYLNYYRNGEDYTPNHSHPGMKQLVISLGATRTLTVGSKSYSMNNGDVIIFGSSTHGVPKEPHIQNGRISIALFLVK